MPRLLLLSLASVLVLLLSACQEIRGPVWSPDSRQLAYTSYTPTAAGMLETSLYVLDVDDESAQPELVAKGAAFPCWALDSQTLYYVGDRDAAGYYTKVYKKKLNSPPQAMLSNQRLINFQMSTNASLALLCTGSSPRMGSAVQLDLWHAATGKLESLRALGEVYSPALMPNGKKIAYAQKPAAALPMLYVCALDGSQPEEVFPTAEENEPNASTYVIHACSDNERFLFYSPGGANLWTIRHDGSNVQKYKLPDGMSSPVMAAFDETEDAVSVTLAQPAAEKILYHVYRVNLKTKVFKAIDGNSTELLGGHALAPKAVHRKVRWYAWFSAGGLTLGEPTKARYYPATATQCTAAVGMLIKQKEPQQAVKLAMKARELQPPPDDLSSLDRAEALALLADQQLDLGATALEKSMLLFPVGPEGIRFVFPPATGLPRPAPAEINATLKELDDLIKALPANRLLPLLKQALQARSQGQQKQALALYAQAVPLMPDEARSGGLRFLEGITAFEDGNLELAAQRWQAAASCGEFPQAAYAAGLSAVAFTLMDRAEYHQKAASVLQMGCVKSSPMAAELAQLPGLVKGRPFPERQSGKETLAGDGHTRAWAEYEIFPIPFAYVSPVRVTDGEGKSTERRIGVRLLTASALWLSGRQQPIMRIPARISDPVFAPGDGAVAFMIEGEVFPLKNTFCDVYVVDPKGALLLGDSNATHTGQVQSRYAVTELSWSGAQELTVTGSEVDVFGGRTPFSRNLSVPVRTQPLGR